jgi:hypothetical protein
MYRSILPAVLASLSLLSACTYDSVRMAERQKCSAMLHAEAQRCYSRTQATHAEYKTAVRKVAADKDEAGAQAQKPVDPRYEQWLP